MSDEVLLQELGRRIMRPRREDNLSQARLSEPAGFSRRTLERLEAGAASTQLSLFLRVPRLPNLLEQILRTRKRQPSARPQAGQLQELWAARSMASVELWGTRISAVVLTEPNGVAIFEVAPFLLSSGLQLAPLVVARAKRTNSTPELPRRTFRDLARFNDME